MLVVVHPGMPFSGLSNLQLPSLIAVIGFFIGGLFTTHLFVSLYIQIIILRAIVRHFKYIVIGILFGIIMTKSEAVSWYRIQEMFRFQSIFMYGIIGSAVVWGIILVAIIKEYRLKIFMDVRYIWPKKTDAGEIPDRGLHIRMGWALTGACPGPIFVLLGQGYTVMIIVIAGALAGTTVYGLLRDKLPQ